MTRETAAHFHAYFAGGDVEFIMKNGDFGQRHFENAHRFLHRQTRFVHESGGFEDEDFLACNHAGPDQAGMFGLL